MNKRKLSILSVALPFVIAVILAACGNEKNRTGNEAEAAAAAGSPDLSKVTLKVGQTGWGNLEAGFKEAGLDDTPYKVEFSVFQGGNLQLEAMAGDHLDIALTSEIPPIFASQAADGGNLQIIAIQKSDTLEQELVIPKGSTVRQVSDLKGKKVAYVKSTTAHYFLVKMLEEAGLNWSDIEPVALSTSDGLSALIGGSVDALASYGNAIISAHQNGATTLASAKDILSGNFPVITTKADIVDPAKHAAIADFLNRLNQYNEWIHNNQKKWAEIVAENTKQPLEQALETLKNSQEQRPTKVTAISDEAIASQQDVADTLQSVGLLTKKVDVKSLWSDAFSQLIK
ncbi:ABC transporter substrate-binding protein [Paenibacillus sp. OAE614]|uniref:ABC transporter substrate-binding protein n=1 Tax=Paenibacillus sp. OAE614 TaxID=2663804 RepID=UPI001A012AB1